MIFLINGIADEETLIESNPRPINNGTEGSATISPHMLTNFPAFFPSLIIWCNVLTTAG